MSDSLIRTWRERVTGAGMSMVGGPHPLQFFVGRDENGHARVVIRGPIKPQRPGLSGLVLVDRFEDQSGQWNLSLTLQDSRFEEVFLRLADDMHARTATAANETIAITRVARVIDEWHRLLSARPVGVLTMEELRGLVGELWLVLNWFTRDRSLESSLEGWLGPLGLPQDFWYEQDGHHEAKCIGPSTTTVRISSAEQLDPPDLQLLVLLVATTDETQQGALNLPSLVARVHDALTETGASDQPLRDRLDHLGVDLDEPFYQDTWFVVASVHAHTVNEQFPAIRSSALPEGIERVRYQIDLDAIRPFRTTTLEAT
jgi:hypothetical protein